MPMTKDDVLARLRAGLREAIDKMEGGSADAEHAALYSLATCVAELLDVSFDSYVSTTDTEGALSAMLAAASGPGQVPEYQPAQLAEILSDVGLVDVTVGRYGSFPVVITGVFPRGAEAGLHVFRVAESLDRAEGTTDRMCEPLWAAIFEPGALDWVTSPIESWNGLTAPQICDKITGWL